MKDWLILCVWGGGSLLTAVLLMFWLEVEDARSGIHSPRDREMFPFLLVVVGWPMVLILAALVGAYALLRRSVRWIVRKWIVA